MVLDALAAKALFAIVLSAASGADDVAAQRPLTVEDRGDVWLVKGTPYTPSKLGERMCYAFFKKRTAEVTGIGCSSRFPLTPQQAATWRGQLSPADFDRVFGPVTRFEPHGIPDIWYALYKGIITTPTAAVEYADVILRAVPTFAGLDKADLSATEHDKIWRVSVHGREVLAVSRDTGGLVGGAP